VRRALVELLTPSVCPACDCARREGEPILCGTCALALRPLARLGPVTTALAYDGTAARLIQRFKFESRSDALDVLVEPLAGRVAGLDADVVVPVPRHPDRIREQGCDPAWQLARALCRRTGLALAPRVLERARAGQPQMELPRARRLANVRGSFRARPGALAGRRALLLDDVTTTGATLAEAARALRASARPGRLTPVALAGTPAL